MNYSDQSINRADGPGRFDRFNLRNDCLPTVLLLDFHNHGPVSGFVEIRVTSVADPVDSILEVCGFEIAVEVLLAEWADGVDVTSEVFY